MAEKRRPGWATEAADNDTNTSPSTVPQRSDLDRRRRAAARRLAPLDCGHADPYDCRAAVPPSPRSTEAARLAWHHLHGLGLLSELSEAVLAEGVAA
ncbi:hypothetical protein GCM10009676_00480 [Prauserella halophila]|uniref:Uncharacterized protein n=1 Tax=Prauserella halophila TaxID=185641 RepID=A0ABN1VW03_9PSEU|nr:hypothetical protein [Prauserella halophila]MCP2234608.1 hypothetical protein [Prauserella halophila]